MALFTVWALLSLCAIATIAFLGITLHQQSTIRSLRKRLRFEEELTDTYERELRRRQREERFSKIQERDTYLIQEEA